VSPHEQESEQEVMTPAGAPSPPAADDDQQAAANAAATEVVDAAPGEGVAADDERSATDEGGEPPPQPDPEAELREQAGRYLQLAQRTQADFDNYRKRMAREVRAAESRGIGRLARELLPALDNLERALQAVESSDPDHDLTKGVRLVASELSNALGRGGVQGFDPTGEPFDPNQHEAVAQHPVEGTAAGTIVQVLQPGYRLNEAVLRPARVIVAG